MGKRFFSSKFASVLFAMPNNNIGSSLGRLPSWIWSEEEHEATRDDTKNNKKNVEKGENVKGENVKEKLSSNPTPSIPSYAQLPITCKWWMQGKCVYGDNCRNAHYVTTQEDVNIIVDASIYAMNLPKNLSENDLRSMAAQYGQVTRVRIHPSRQQDGKRSCNVHFTKAQAAVDFVKFLNKKEINGSVIAARIQGINEYAKEAPTCPPCPPSVPTPGDDQSVPTCPTQPVSDLKSQPLPKPQLTLAEMALEPPEFWGPRITTPYSNEDLQRGKKYLKDNDGVIWFFEDGALMFKRYEEGHDLHGHINFYKNNQWTHTAFEEWHKRYGKTKCPKDKPTKPIVDEDGFQMQCRKKTSKYAVFQLSDDDEPKEPKDAKLNTIPENAIPEDNESEADERALLDRLKKIRDPTDIEPARIHRLHAAVKNTTSPPTAWLNPVAWNGLSEKIQIDEAVRRSNLEMETKVMVHKIEEAEFEQALKASVKELQIDEAVRRSNLEIETKTDEKASDEEASVEEASVKETSVDYDDAQLAVRERFWHSGPVGRDMIEAETAAAAAEEASVDEASNASIEDAAYVEASTQTTTFKEASTQTDEDDIDDLDDLTLQDNEPDELTLQDNEPDELTLQDNEPDELTLQDNEPDELTLQDNDESKQHTPHTGQDKRITSKRMSTPIPEYFADADKEDSSQEDSSEDECDDDDEKFSVMYLAAQGRK